MIFFIALMMMTAAFGQSLDQKIDSLISAQTTKPFNGIVLVFQDGTPKYSKAFGYSDLERKENKRIV
jgi:hypothetical protein